MPRKSLVLALFNEHDGSFWRGAFEFASE